ncbi:MAG: restriction endonuclease subunit S [Phycisphaeraceae bacterium]|nr:restriction endonuclease subunit S [Phycisphaeraceae bacterium]
MRDGWVETKLGQYIQINTGKRDVNASSEFGAYPFFTCSRETYRIDEAAFDGEYVLVAGNGDLNVKYYDGKFNAYQRTYVLKSVDKAVLDNRFLYVYMQTYVDYLRSETRGTVIQYLKKDQFTDAKIKLPPLPEQKRIVDLISTVDSYIDALRQQLERAKRSRGAVLHELLTERTGSWAEESLSDVSEVVMGRQLSPSKKMGNRPRPYIRAANIGSWGINLDEIFVMDFTEKEEEKFAVQIGDTLLVEGGNEKSVGCPALVSDREAGLCIQNHVIRCRSKDYSKLDPDFQYYLLRFMYWRGDFGELCAGTTIMHLGQKRVALLKVSLPPLEKQREIVEVVSSFDAVVNVLETASNRATKLRSGLLSELLSGDHEIPANYDQVIAAP